MGNSDHRREIMECSGDEVDIFLRTFCSSFVSVNDMVSVIGKTREESFRAMNGSNEMARSTIPWT